MSFWGPIANMAGGVLSGGLSGLFGRENKQTPMQGKQQELVDQLLASLQGGGPFSGLFNMDENAFQKSFVDPMKQKFQSQIAPQIQQSFIADGQQRGTGMQGNLTRAGVDMDQLLNEYYAQMQEGAMNRQSGAMGNILKMGAGAPETPSMGQAFQQGVSGALGTDQFGKSFQDIINSFTNSSNSNTPQKKGFENDASVMGGIR